MNKENRSFDIEKHTNEDDPNILSFSVASPTPYLRVKDKKEYLEILEITEESVDFTRLVDNRAPLLYNHDEEQQIGVVERAWIDGERLYVEVRFSRSSFAQEILNDCKDGIRRNVSIGYIVNDYEMTKGNEYPEMHVKNFTIYEISIVSAPADPFVGVGRSLKTKGGNDMKKIKENEEELKDTLIDEEIKDEKEIADSEEAKDEEEIKDEIKDEKEDSKSVEEDPEKEEEYLDEEEIRSLGDLTDHKELAKKFIKEKRSYNDFKKEIRNLKNSKNTLEDKHNMENRFSLRKALLNTLGKMSNEDAAFERSVIDENKRKYNIADADIVLSKKEIRAMFDGTTDAALINTQYRPDLYTENLRAPNAIDATGTRKVSVSGSSISFAVATKGLAGGYVTLNGDIPGSDMAFETKTMTPHKVGVYTQCCYQSLLQDDPEVETIIMNDIIKALDEAKDKAFFAGKAAANEPIGLLETTGVNEIDLTAATIDISIAYKFEKAIRDSGDYSQNLKWVMGPEAYYTWATTPVKATALNEFLISDGKCINYPVVISNAIPSGQIILGNFDEALEADFDGISLKIVEDAALSRKQACEIQCFAANDFLLRRPKSFAKSK